MQTYLEHELAKRAMNSTYIQVQSAAAAKTIEEFARKWMSDDGQKISEKAGIEVVF